MNTKELNQDICNYFSFNLLKRNTFEVKSGRGSNWHGVRSVSEWTATIGHCEGYSHFEMDIVDFEKCVNVGIYKDGELFTIKYDIIPNKWHHTFYYFNERLHTHFGIDWVGYFKTYLCRKYIMRWHKKKPYIIHRANVCNDIPKKENKYKIFIPDYICAFLIENEIESQHE